MLQPPLNKLDECEEPETLDDSLIDSKHEEDLEGIGSYHSDEDVSLDDNKIKNQMALSKQGKKRHLTPQESISDTEFFSQRFDGPGLKNLSKQDNIIEEEEPTYPIVEPKIIPPRIPTTREVTISISALCREIPFHSDRCLMYIVFFWFTAANWTVVVISCNDHNNNGSSAYN